MIEIEELEKRLNHMEKIIADNLELHGHIEKIFLDTPVFKVTTWAIIVVLVVIFGGTVISGIQVRDHATIAKQEIDKKKDEVLRNLGIPEFGDAPRLADSLHRIDNNTKILRDKINGHLGFDTWGVYATKELGEEAGNKSCNDLGSGKWGCFRQTKIEIEMENNIFK